MDFELSEQHKMLARVVRDFMEKEIESIGEQIDREDKFPEGIWRKMGELGWLGLSIPEEYGGSGSDYLAEVILASEVGRVCPALGMSLVTHTILGIDSIYRNGTEEQRRKYLPPLCRGEKVGGLAMTEPDAGSDVLGGMRLRANKEGDYYVLNGTKTFITNGPISECLIVYAVTNPEKGSHGITAFIVEKGFAGSFTARHLEKIGMRGSPTGELSFQDYRVPKENILGKENEGSRILMRGLDIERVGAAGFMLGGVERALELSLSYSKERVQFGQPLANFQLIQEKLVYMYTMLEACRTLVYRAADLANKVKIQDTKELWSELRMIASAALLITGETCMKAALDCLQIHGGYGYMMESAAGRLFRDAKLAEIGAGTVEIRKCVIADGLIKHGLRKL